MKSRLALLVAATLTSGCGARSSLSVPEPEKDPCAAVACETPPEPTCVSATTLRTSSAPGTCSAGECSYASMDTECPTGCLAGKCSTPMDRVRISAGKFFTCAVTAAGAVKCWGSDANGQLGDSSTGGKSNVPIDVENLSSGVLAVSAGAKHACAVTSAGAVKCWGSNDSGQLGDPSVFGDGYMVDVIGLSSGVAALSAGATETCAVTTTGAVKCWGSDTHGPLLGISVPDPAGPKTIPELSSGVLAISTAVNHTCAVVSGGAVECCGGNAFGQLGTGSTGNSPVFVGVTGLPSSVLAISTGLSATCAVDTAGATRCWGQNLHGQLGNGTTTDSLVPVDVAGLSSGVVDISLGLNHACALTSVGGVKCWGWNFYGELGNGSTADSFVPVDVVGLSSGVVAISVGLTHTCAITATEAMKCWGSNLSGELGDGTADTSNVPVDVVGF